MTNKIDYLGANVYECGYNPYDQPDRCQRRANALPL
jgi:hypothetical protein